MDPESVERKVRTVQCGRWLAAAPARLAPRQACRECCGRDLNGGDLNMQALCELLVGQAPVD
jgi:hypothetical protein